MDVELDPDQPDEVARTVSALLQSEREPDPWWQAGIDAALDNTDS